MPNSRTTYKFLDLLTVFAVFFTPLLFFTQSRDQFELPKLTFLLLLAIPLLYFQLKENNSFPSTPLTWSLGVFFLTQATSSLPATSLSWRTSLLGDYENFSGLTTLTAYFIWFGALNRLLNDAKIEKLFYFNSLAAFLSSLYAIGQHYGFDFIRWNPESVNSTREFASLGNPNFLSAYLAMSIPLYLGVSLKAFSQGPSPSREAEPFWGFIGLLGFLFLLLGTAKGLYFIHLAPTTTLMFPARTLGPSPPLHYLCPFEPFSILADPSHRFNCPRLGAFQYRQPWGPIRGRGRVRVLAGSCLPEKRFVDSASAKDGRYP